MTTLIASDEQRVTELVRSAARRARPEDDARGRVPRRAVRPRPRVGALPRGQRRPRHVAEAAEHDQRAASSAAGAPLPYGRNPIGYGMCAPTIVTHGSDAQKQRYLRPLFTGEEIWCQMFSEPGAGSDVASLSMRADAGRRRVDAQRAEGVDHARARLGVRHRPRAYRPGDREAQGHDDVRRRHARARCRGAAARPGDG